ncbi:SdpI family protein [Actinomycetospora cinnamomea]|uniref:SdpI/YhfL family protein n=1 Tax=Actinomycetospora cinnamomea TaxID=663609 RepID=A0A2U1FFI4_9PSEU|nr:SdpI family protein [Actinomycetospora cinnamomea]PVZ10919.1 SdpI/YhfL family protein [Actinomycetospora cinnamomea]
MIVPALVLMVAALVVGVVGVLASVYRLPRNRVIGVRTVWTMSNVAAFRRANRAAAPAFVGAGVVGLGAAVAALLAATTPAGVVMLVLGGIGLVGLLGVGGVVGARVAAAEEAEHEALASSPPAPCTAGEPEPERATCAPAGACGGSCAICPRAQAEA